MKIFNKLALILSSVFLTATLVSAGPEIFSPEDFGPAICVGCCDDNGNQLPSDPDCGCEVKDSCGVCGGDNSSCGCELFDCAGNPFPDPLAYCHLDVNRDKLITHEDAQAVIDYLEVNRRNSVEVTEDNKRFNTSQTDNFITPLDSLRVINFLNSNVPGVTKVDSCNVCGGSGKNVCGTCPNTGDFVEPVGPDGRCGCPNATDYSGPFNSECQICTNLGKDSCGRCPGENEYNTSCATPTPSPSPSPSLTPTPTPSRTPTPTPSQTPTPIPSPTPPPVCEVYTLENLNHSKTIAEEKARWLERYETGENWDLFSGEGGQLNCLDSLVTNAINACKRHPNMEGRNNPCNLSKGPDGLWKNRITWFGDDIHITDLLTTFFEREPLLPTHFANRDEAEISYTLKGKYITKNCEILDTDVDPALICGSLKIDMLVSPISLNWNEKEDGKNEISFVDFAIIPNSTGKFFLWKASGDQPLLAIDINKDGIINDGTELFGNWTFGGKASSSLSSTSNKAAWKNGYEALATLDTDKNGVVEGNELKDIVLWFDYNKNGKSDEGELVKAEDSDLSKLFYKPSHSEPINGDLIATKGFERKINGKNVEGSSVDWYSKSYNSVAEGITSQQLNWLSTNQKTSQSTNGINETPHSAVGSNVPSKGENIDYSGIWKWQIDGGKTPEGGLLVLLQNMEGAVIGESSAIVPVFPAQGQNEDIQGVVARYQIKGQIMKAENDRDILKFTTYQDDLKTENSVQLVNGRLVGRSTGQLAKSDKETSTVSYTWTATRIDK